MFRDLVVVVVFLLVAMAAVPFLSASAGVNNGNGAQHGNNPAQGGTSANPNGQGDGGNGIHNIAGIQDRQGRQGGTPPACTAHGGLVAKNKNC